MKTKTKYTVCIRRTTTDFTNIEVEAENEQEAEKLAMDDDTLFESEWIDGDFEYDLIDVKSGI